MVQIMACHHAIPWINDNLLSIGHPEANRNQNGKFSFKKIHFKTSSAKWQPLFSGINELIQPPTFLADVPQCNCSPSGASWESALECGHGFADAWPLASSMSHRSSGVPNHCRAKQWTWLPLRNKSWKCDHPRTQWQCQNRARLKRLTCC